MVGAKQFSAIHKLTGKKGNPIIQKLTTPQLMEKQQPIKGSPFPFYERFKQASKASKPKIKTSKIEKTELICLTDISPMFSHLFPMKECENIEIKDNSESEIDISDETLNKITYKIFQNIQRYLKGGKEEPKENKQIKILIDM